MWFITIVLAMHLAGGQEFVWNFKWKTPYPTEEACKKDIPVIVRQLYEDIHAGNIPMPPDIEKMMPPEPECVQIVEERKA